MAQDAVSLGQVWQDVDEGCLYLIVGIDDVSPQKIFMLDLETGELFDYYRGFLKNAHWRVFA